uniref:Uncharacterized protein n=1 Tax=viral metagenome TaxID=1070528 RepID=A0A6M3IGA3_9ZZZZ
MRTGSITASSSNSLLISSGDVDIFASGDLDDYFTFSVTTNRPLFSGTGNYLVLGKDAATGHSLDADDVLFGEDVEIDGVLYPDGTVSFNGTFTDDCLDFTSVAINHTGSNGPCLIRAGTYASPVSNADEDQSGMIRLYSTTSAGGTSYDRGVFACCKTTNTKGVFPVAGLAEVNAIASGTGPNKVQAGQFIAHLNDATALLATMGGDATAGMYGTWNKITSEVGSVASAGSRAAAVWVDNQMNGTVSGEEYGIFSTTGGSVPDAWAAFETTSSGWAQLFYFDETAYDQAPISGTSLKVLVNASQYYLPFSLTNTGFGAADDALISVGTNQDGVIVNVSTGLAADQPIAGVIIGTPDTPAFANNTLIIANATADGDILIAGNDGGHSRTALFFDSSAGILHLGKPGTPVSAIASGDVYCGGILESQGALIALTSLGVSTTFSMATNDQYMRWGASALTYFMSCETADANALCPHLELPTGAGNNVTVLPIGDASLFNLDLGLFDGITQPTIAMIEKNEKYAAVSNATSTGADVAVLTTATAGTFTNAAVGDIVRVTAGTNATVGWYWITTVTDQYNITLDRNWCTVGAVTGGTIVVYHDFTMLSADGICTRITDGAPDDSSVEIDRAGWLILDVGQANGRLYWRTGAAWHYVDATAGLSLPKEERIDTNGHEFQLGETVSLVVDKINNDGSFHAMPVYGG